ncbi:uncharacterized protein PAC_14483 [Phialocephala subalpina]|uniref:AB hydrolase-1 domain-containing protein n=1 Tax=Phialocephala subalpina TaxID=576137 RepID=A0A1L7XHR4_9HELO|nr:uncharacterized protein PAC_14483 [Phialocephala subalpina]
MDLRGLGLSTPIKCDPDIMNERISYFPTTEAEFEQLVSHNKIFRESCLNLTGPLAGHIDTVSVAHDMEALRTALGEGKLNYLGLSYGTQPGSQYAELYQDNIRAMVLVANADHGVTETSMFVTESSTAEDEFKRFALYCSTTPECALYGKNATDLFLELIDQASTAPIPALGCTGNGDCRTNVTSEDILFIVQNFLVFEVLPQVYTRLEPGWLDFGQAISDALSGDAAAFSLDLFSTPQQLPISPDS